MRLSTSYNLRVDSMYASNEKIVASYSKANNTTTLVVDADIVTIGLVARLLQEQYDAFLSTMPDMKTHVDKAIDAAMRGE